jgi:hypothetical protein
MENDQLPRQTQVKHLKRNLNNDETVVAMQGSAAV